MFRNQSFNPKLIIADHFDEIKNQIDIETETAVCEINLNENDRKILNDLRKEQLETIEKVQEKNLLNINFSAESFASKWSHVIDDSKLTFEQKLERIKEKIILTDCVLIEDSEYKSRISLWVMPCFYNQKDLKFLRYF